MSFSELLIDDILFRHPFRALAKIKRRNHVPMHLNVCLLLSENLLKVKFYVKKDVKF